MSYEAFGDGDDMAGWVTEDRAEEMVKEATILLQAVADAALDLEQILAKCIKCGETEIVSTELGGEALKDRLNTLCAALKAAGIKP